MIYVFFFKGGSWQPWFAVYLSYGLIIVAATQVFGCPHTHCKCQGIALAGLELLPGTPHNDSGETRPQRANRFRYNAMRCAHSDCDTKWRRCVGLSMTPCCQCDLLLPIVRINRSIMLPNEDVCQVTYVAPPTQNDLVRCRKNRSKVAEVSLALSHSLCLFL